VDSESERWTVPVLCVMETSFGVFLAGFASFSFCGLVSFLLVDGCVYFLSGFPKFEIFKSLKLVLSIKILQIFAEIAQNFFDLYFTF
jgi:hypothetical protein